MDLLIDLEDDPEPITGIDVYDMLIQEMVHYALHPEQRFWLN